MFPFALPPFDEAKTATDVSWMNSIPAGSNGFIKTEGERFVDGTGEPIRFWGVNLNFNGVFPPKEQAPGIAARLAKFGFNAVRIHHFDGNAAPTGIWKPLLVGGSRLKIPREFDATQLDRFDFFMAELLKRGIYIDLNLHVARKVLTEEGFSQASALPDKDKGVDYFDAKLIGAQQEFSRAILRHINPYTQRAYADEPGVCTVEMTNEDSLLGMWLDGSFSKIPEPYARALREQWNDWLKSRYDESALRAAWTELDNPLGRDDILAMPYPRGIANPNAPDARLDIGVKSLRRFQFKKDSGAVADVDLDPLGGPTIDGFVRPGLSILLKSLGNEKWGFQLNRDALDLQDEQPYTLKFYARADAPRRISVNLWQDKQPYNFYGFTGYADLGTDWQQYSFVFRPSQPESKHARINFNFGKATGTVQLAEMSLQAGGKLAAPPNWTLSNGVPLIELRTTQVRNARRDFAHFLGDIESAYAQKQRTFLRDELGVKCPIWTTQAQFGGWGGMWRERASDAIDVHAYWKHPVFEAGGWSGTAWRVENSSMTTSPATDPLTGFSHFRLKDKPFVMSEWNSGQPNDFGQESLLMIAAYAAWQDWAGVYLFDYHSYGDYKRDAFRGFFSIDAHPAKMATATAAALVFRRPQKLQKNGHEEADGMTLPPLGDVSVAERETNLIVPEDLVWLKVAGSAGQPTPALVLPTWRESGVARGAALCGKVYARFGDVPFAIADRLDADPQNVWISDLKEIKWSRKPGLFTLNAPQSKIAVGFLGGYRLSLGAWKIAAPSRGNNFVTFALSSLDGAPLTASKRVLLTATGRAENIGMGWNAARDSVGKEWGIGPTRVEGMTAEIQLLTDRSDLKVYALDVTGARTGIVASTLQNGKLQFAIAPHWETVWYEIVAE